MSYAFGLLSMGVLLLIAGVQNRSLVDVLRGVISPAGETGAGGLAFAPLAGGGAENMLASAPLSGEAAAVGGMVQVDGHPVCAWIARELLYARAHGAHFTVTSGYRSAAEQARICSQTTGPCADPGQSNHQGRHFPSCAVDVDGADSLNAHLRPGSPLRWTGRSIGDMVHFSSGLAGV